MNCKQGDLARVVNSQAGNNDKIVQCLEYVGLRWWLNHDGDRLAPTWRIDRELPPLEGFGDDDLIEDSKLRPIRDSDGTDETLTWAGLPAKPEVTA